MDNNNQAQAPRASHGDDRTNMSPNMHGGDEANSRQASRKNKKMNTPQVPCEAGRAAKKLASEESKQDDAKSMPKDNDKGGAMTASNDGNQASVKQAPSDKQEINHQRAYEKHPASKGRATNEGQQVEKEQQVTEEQLASKAPALQEETANKGQGYGKAEQSGLQRIRYAANRDDARFVKQERLIQRGLEKAVARRRIGLKTIELCREAGIASPTFYSHYRNCDEALIGYEVMLEENFVRSLSRGMRKDVVLTKLLAFVRRHQKYFAAAFKSRNLYLLYRLVRHALPYTETVQLRPYILYTWSVGAMIFCYGECDKFSDRRLEAYHKGLMRLRLMDWGI